MAQAKKQEVTTPKQTSVGLPAAWKTELANEAKQESARETPSVANISFRSGVLSVGGVAVPGGEMQAIVMASAYERTLYDGKFDPNKIKNPVCFALSITGEDMSPHENSLHPQNATCMGCPMNEWGSAGEGRRGKACKETRRIALIPADKLESVADIASSELAMAKVPVTSVRNWSNYVNKVAAMYNVPFWAVMTKMVVRPHIKNQFEVTFETSDTIEDLEALQALKQKRQYVDSFVMAPYSMAVDEEEEVEVKAPTKPAPTMKRKF